MSSWNVKTVELRPIDAHMASFVLPAMRIEDRRLFADREKPSYITHAYCPCCLNRFLFLTEATQKIVSPDDAMCLGCLQAVATIALKLNEGYEHGDPTWRVALREKQLRLGTLPTQRCSNPACKVSSGIDDSVTFGSGDLDPNGYWEHPCLICATAHLSKFPMDRVWPRNQAIVNLVEADNHPYDPDCDCQCCEQKRLDKSVFPEHGDPDDHWTADPENYDECGDPVHCHGCAEYGSECPAHGTRDDNWSDDPNLGDQ